MKLLKICNEKYNQTIVVVTHDEKVAQMCDRIIYIEDEYSCAVTPQVRQTGNRLSGLAGTAYASLLA